MNAKRIAAIVGLVGIGASILFLLLSGFLPAYKDVLQSLSAVGFLVAAAIAGIIWLRGREQAKPEDSEDDKAE